MASKSSRDRGKFKPQLRDATEVFDKGKEFFYNGGMKDSGISTGNMRHNLLFGKIISDENRKVDKKVKGCIIYEEFL